ncbi:transcriptional repressor LexA [Candidatus Dojkabacteria bacterium]|nr:transcriptional repressor LexA [Candidatus Dojkabacteria bacterium]
MTNNNDSGSTPVLYPKQREVYEFISTFIYDHGYAPTLTEIKDFLGVKALSTVHEHLEKLEQKGLIERIDGSITLKNNLDDSGNIFGVAPLLGVITAGQPIDAFEEPEPVQIPLPAELTNNKRVFCLRVRGDSMVESLIADGDIVICEKVDFAKNGDTVVALLDDNTATLKKFYKERNVIRLQPANSRYDPIMVKNVTIQGRVIAIYRKCSI